MTGGRPWRTMREIEPGGLHDGAGAEQAEGGRAEDLRLPGPGGEDREQRQDVDGHADVEGLGPVEGGLVVDVGLGVGPGSEGDDLKILHRLVEGGGVLDRVGPGDPGHGLESGIHRAHGHSAERLARVGPGLGLLAGQRRDGPEVGQVRERGLALRRARSRGPGDLGGQTGRLLELDGVLEPVVEVEPLEEVGDRALVRRAQLRVDGLRRVGLALDLVDERDDLPEGVVAILRPLQLHDSQHVGVVDDEDGLEVGHLGPEEHVEDPLARAHRPVLVAEALLPTDQEQRVAGRRVERLQPAALQHREAREPVDVEPANLPGGAKHEKGPDQRQATGDPGCVLAELALHVMPPAPTGPDARPRASGTTSSG